MERSGTAETIAVPGRRGTATAFERPDKAVGVLLVNLGTPDAPTAAALRAFLREFLSDPRVVDRPRRQWWPILHLFIVPFRSPRSARLYRKIWTEHGSPLLAHTLRLREAVATTLQRSLATPVHVVACMRYGQPSISATLRELRERGCTRLLVVPLFPQYSCTTVESVYDAVSAELATWRVLPELRVVHRYHDAPAYIDAIAGSIREAWARGGEPERLVFSFHGIPERYVTAGDPYAAECRATTELVAEALNLPDEFHTVSFQSVFGREKWIGPSTVNTVRRMAQTGIKHIDVICPGFAADCLETLEEIDHGNRRVFLEHGGTRFRYIPCLNDHPAHVRSLVTLLRRNLDGWVRDAGEHAPVISGPPDTTAEADGAPRRRPLERAPGP